MRDPSESVLDDCEPGKTLALFNVILHLLFPNKVSSDNTRTWYLPVQGNPPSGGCGASLTTSRNLVLEFTNVVTDKEEEKPRYNSVS